MSYLLLFLIIFKYVLKYTFDFYHVFILQPVEEFNTIKKMWLVIIFFFTGGTQKVVMIPGPEVAFYVH